MQGKVVGVNTLLQPHGQNLGFAVSAGDVSAVLHLPFVPMALLQQTPTTQSRFVSSAAAIKRIRRFAIIVDTLTPDAVAGGLREGDVRGLVENRLHNAGIKITERAEKSGDGFFDVNLSTIGNVDNSSIGYFSYVSVSQLVSLPGASPQQYDEAEGCIWKGTAVIGYSDRSRFATKVLQAVAQRVDDFVEQYLKVAGSE